MSAVPDDRSRALWRAQVVLTALAVFAFAGVAGLTRLVLSEWGRAPANRAELLAVATIIGIAVVALLGAACLHVLRIAQLLLSAKIPTSETD